MKLIIQLYGKLLLQQKDPDGETVRALVLSCCSDDSRIERKNDFHDFWLIVYTTNYINGNPFRYPRLSVSGFKCSRPATP